MDLIKLMGLYLGCAESMPIDETHMTKTVLCTLGPSSLDPQTIKQLDELKVDLFRLNLSHIALEEIERLVDLIRSVSDVPICLDTQGAQIRTGAFAGGQATFESGTEVDLVAVPAEGDETLVPLHPDVVLPQLAPGDLINIGFGSIALQVIETGKRTRARVVGSGVIWSNRAVSLDRAIALPAMTDTDHAAVQQILRLGIKNVAMSFTNRRQDIELLRRIVGDQVHITAKIESRLALENLAGILEVADSILIDRGDLAYEVDLESLPFIQKEVIGRANAARVPVYVATNLLESMVVSRQPTRAEVNDVINTLLDGADGLVLAAETAIGDYPVNCLRMIRSLIQRYEAHMDLSGAPEETASVVGVAEPLTDAEDA